MTTPSDPARKRIVEDAMANRAHPRLRWTQAILWTITLLALAFGAAATWYALEQRDKAAEAGLSIADRVAAECAKDDADRAPFVRSDPTLCQDAQEVADDPANTDVVTGRRGPRGFPGADGTDGQDGTPGADGDRGRPGADGKDGRQGPAGDDGEAGTDGDPGADGQDGAAGPAGPQGPQGEQGPAGQDGTDGQNPTCPDGSEPQWTQPGAPLDDRYYLTCPPPQE